MILVPDLIVPKSANCSLNHLNPQKSGAYMQVLLEKGGILERGA